MPTLEQVSPATPTEDERWSRWTYNYWRTYSAPARGPLLRRQQQLAQYRYRLAGGPRVRPVAMLRANELLGMAVYDLDGRRIATIRYPRSTASDQRPPSVGHPRH